MKIIITEEQFKKLILENKFSEVYTEYYPKLLRNVCMKYSNGNLDKAEDFCQDGFVKASQRFDQFDGSNLGGWLSTLMRNHILDQLRKEKNKTFFTDFDFSRYDPHDEEYDELFMGKYSEKDIDDAISSLPKNQEKVFRMYYFDDLKHDEIAKKLGVSDGTSKSQLHKAKSRVKEFLENKWKKLI